MFDMQKSEAVDDWTLEQNEYKQQFQSEMQNVVQVKAR